MAIFVTIALLAVAALAMALILKFLSSRPRGRNPFGVDERRAPAPYVADSSARDAVLKQGFTPAKVAEAESGAFDVVVIGSGISGLTSAVLLARAGKKVLVLEQHDQAGGCCHTFYEKGYEFDTGVHYIGEMRNNTMVRFVLQQLTAGQLLWTDMDKAFDIVKLGTPDSPQGVETFPIMSGSRKVFVDNLVAHFPKERAGIEKFVDMVDQHRRSVPAGMSVKLMGRFALRAMKFFGLVDRFTPYFKISGRTLQEVLDEVTTDDKLKAVLSYSYGDYGNRPEDASFGMHAFLFSHMMYGTSYPRGGPSEIPFHIIPEIEKLDGRVIVRAKVSSILLSPSGAVSGVRVVRATGTSFIDIPCSSVVSTAGVFNTFETLLPEEVRSKHASVERLLSGVKHSVSCFSLFVGLNKSSADLELPASSYWAFPGVNMNKDLTDYLAMDPAEAAQTIPPVFFISFPSSKDSTWDARLPNKSSALVIIPATYEWFQEWEDERIMKRSSDYKELKAAFQATFLKRLCSLLPQLEAAVDYVDLGTPVTNRYYFNAPEGETYAADHNLERFSLDTFSGLRPDTVVPGLFLSGQDVLTCGLVSAMLAGVMTTSVMLQRNLMAEAYKLRAKSPVVQASFPMKSAAAAGSDDRDAKKNA